MPAGGLRTLSAPCTMIPWPPFVRRTDDPRVGRPQGDPGETKMLLDCVDPLMVMFGMDKVSAMLSQLGSQLQVRCGPYAGPHVGVGFLVGTHRAASDSTY